MTIAEPIQTLEYLKNSGVFPFSTIDGVLYTEESIDVVIDTMRKYQKIRDKISTIYVGYRHGYEVMADVMKILREVENGNDEK